MRIGENIKKFRELRGFSVEDLAERLNVSAKTIVLWEKNELVPNNDQLIELATILQVTIDELNGNGKTNPMDQQDDYIYSSEILYDDNFIKDFYAIFYSKRITLLFTMSIYIFVTGVWLLGTSSSETKILFGLFFFLIGIAGFIRTFVMRKMIIDLNNNALKFEPNKRFQYYFYRDHVRVEMTSDASSSRMIIRYDHIKRIVIRKKYIFFQYLNNYYSIPKNSIEDQSTKFINFLRSQVASKNSIIKKKKKKRLDKDKFHTNRQR